MCEGSSINIKIIGIACHNIVSEHAATGKMQADAVAVARDSVPAYGAAAGRGTWHSAPEALFVFLFTPADLFPATMDTTNE